MIGRMAAIAPWIFTVFSGKGSPVDHAAVWDRFFLYVNEDFEPTRAIGRIKEFTAWYARNFFFGHNLFVAVQGAPTLEDVRERAMAFLTRSPQLAENPTAMSNV
jgi:tRNA-dihydrouridine synthase B